MCGKSQGPFCEWCEFGQAFNGQLEHLFKLGDWKTTESWPMLKVLALKTHSVWEHPFYNIMWEEQLGDPPIDCKTSVNVQ